MRSPGTHCLVLVATLAVAACRRDAPPRASGESPGVQRVSPVQILAAPASYDGKRILTAGYCDLAFEGTSLWLHEEDLKQNLVTNAVWLDIDTQRAAVHMAGPVGYAAVEGVFRADMTAHRGVFRGGIEVSKIDRIASRSESISGSGSGGTQHPEQ
jgi:hypothetical protein